MTFTVTPIDSTLRDQLNNTLPVWLFVRPNGDIDVDEKHADHYTHSMNEIQKIVDRVTVASYLATLPEGAVFAIEDGYLLEIYGESAYTDVGHAEALVFTDETPGLEELSATPFREGEVTGLRVCFDAIVGHLAPARVVVR